MEKGGAQTATLHPTRAPMPALLPRLLFLVGMFPLAANAQPGATLSTGSLTLPPGQSGVVEIRLDPTPYNNGIYGLQVEWQFDPAVLRIEEAGTVGTLLAGALIFASSPAPGRFRIASATTAPLIGSGVLVYLTVTGLAPGESRLKPVDVMLNEGDPPVAASEGWVTVSVTPPQETTGIIVPDTTLLVGGRVRLPIHLRHGRRPIYSTEAELTYDPAFITPLAADTVGASGVPAGAATRVDFTEFGKVRLWIASPRPLVAGELLTIEWAGAGSAGETRIEAPHILFNDGDPQASFLGGTLWLRTRTPGDVDGDDTITELDAWLVLDFLAGRIALDTVQRAAAEVSGNGVLSSFDVALILQVAGGSRTCFPVEPGCPAGKRGPSRGPSHGTVTLEVIDASTLGFRYITGESPAYSLTVALPSGQDRRFDLPADWRVAERVRGDSTYFELAGLSPLPEGVFLGITGAGSTLRIFLDDIPMLLHAPPLADALWPPHPNPARHVAEVAFDLALPGPVRLELYDPLGRRVAVLAESPHEAGRHRIQIPRGSLSAGVYFIVLNTAGVRHTRSLVLY